MNNQSMQPERSWTGEEPLLNELSSDLLGHPLLPARPWTMNTSAFIPATLQRTHAAGIPYVPEAVLARHFGRLARRNHSIHQGLYPLGSCTMKYNPVVNEELSSLEGFAALHPYQDPADAQGTLGLMWELEHYLTAITGTERMTLQPAAGAQGEWTGLRMIQAYHASLGDMARTKVLIPDSAHGTNPASANLCGYEVVTIRSNADGTVSLSDLDDHLDATVAAIMMTNPNTLGVFEKQILQIAEHAHAAGAQLYYDGANLNALVGIARPGDMGFDVVHLNLHKTFSTPHGGGGPGSGPVGAAPHLVPFLPLPRVDLIDGMYQLTTDHPMSIGKVRSFYGNVGMLIRAYAFIRTYGDTLSTIAQHAVLNARYLHALLKGTLTPAVTGTPMHEFVMTTHGSATPELRALDIAKSLIDYGVHPPTVYFPTTVPEAMMLEPTETETKATLDAFTNIIKEIVATEITSPGSAHRAPMIAPVSRVDEVNAARHPILQWKALSASEALKIPTPPISQR